MISLRYHVVSLTAVFLALALGVVLGSTALSGTLLSGLSDEKGKLAAQVSDLQAQRNGLTARLADADAFAGSAGPKIVAGVLDRRSVLVVTTDDAGSTDRDALEQLIRQAGATVSGELHLTSAFTDPARSDQLRQLAIRLQPAGATFPTAGDPGTLAGALIGSVLVLDKTTARPQSSADEVAATISGLTDGGFVRPSPNLGPGQLAVVLTGGQPGGEHPSDRAAILARFAAQVQRSGAGAVLAGEPASASGNGAIGFARADTSATSTLSTVDNVDTAAGRVAVILALAEQLDGKAGGYGVAGNAHAPAPGTSGR